MPIKSKVRIAVLRTLAWEGDMTPRRLTYRVGIRLRAPYEVTEQPNYIVAGLIESIVPDPDYPNRHLYRITALGRAMVQEARMQEVRETE